jgi:hypothetical protein
MWEVDANHDTIIAVGNAGPSALKAQVTLYYNSGKDKYYLERTLGRDEQLWMDLNKIIRDQIPDKNGTRISLDVMSGTYELDSLGDEKSDGLFEGKLVVDKTYGYAVHGCGDCCPHEFDFRYIVQDPLDLGYRCLHRQSGVASTFELGYRKPSGGHSGHQRSCRWCGGRVDD